MDFQLAEKKYRALAKKLQSGKMTPDKYHAEIEKLRFQSNNGVWWQLNGHDGSWLMYKDEHWVSYTPSEYMGPKSLKSMLLILLKNMPKVLLMSFAKRLLLALVIAGIVLIGHTILLVGPNGGFAPGNVFFNNILALKGRIHTGTLFWMIATGVLFSSFHRLRTLGVRNFFQTVGITIVDFGHSVSPVLKRKNPRETTVFMVAMVVGLIQVLSSNDGMLGLLIVLWLLLAVAAGNQSFLYLFAKLTVSDLERLFKLKRRFSRRMLEMIFYGVIGGILLSILLLNFPYAINRWLRMGVVVGIVVWLFLKTPKTQSATLWILWMIGAAACLNDAVYGDDGGWSEAGGTLLGWLQSEGALTAVLMGIPPAVGGGAMIIFMDALLQLFNDILYNYPDIEWGPEVLDAETMARQWSGATVGTGVVEAERLRMAYNEEVGGESSEGSSEEAIEGARGEGARSESAEDARGKAIKGARGRPTEGTHGESTEDASGEGTDGASGEATDGASGEVTDGASGEGTDGASGEATDGAHGEATEGASGEATDGASREGIEGAHGESTDDTSGEAPQGVRGEPGTQREGVPMQVPEELPQRTVKDIQKDQDALENRLRLEEQRLKEHEERIRKELEKQRKLEILRERQKWLEAEANAANRTSRWWDWGTSAVEGVQKACDISIDLLATVTGPPGQRVKDVYNLSKGLGEGVGKSIAEGGNWKNNMIDGAVKGAYDVTKGKFFDKIAAASGNKIPGIKQYGPGDSVGEIWSKGRVGFFKDALTGKTHSTVSGMVKDRFVEGAKNAAQSQGQNLATSSVDKSICGWLSSKIKRVF